jgi:hypothetical protein
MSTSQPWITGEIEAYRDAAGVAWQCRHADRAVRSPGIDSASLE